MHNSVWRCVFVHTPVAWAGFLFLYPCVFACMYVCLCIVGGVCVCISVSDLCPQVI